MWSRGPRILWCKVHIQKGKNLRFSVPISLNVLLELLDCAHDLTTLVCMFAPRPVQFGPRFSMDSLKDIIQMLMSLIGSMKEDGPYDLLDVSADQVNITLKVK